MLKGLRVEVLPGGGKIITWDPPKEEQLELPLEEVQQETQQA